MLYLDFSAIDADFNYRPAVKFFVTLIYLSFRNKEISSVKAPFNTSAKLYCSLTEREKLHFGKEKKVQYLLYQTLSLFCV